VVVDVDVEEDGEDTSAERAGAKGLRKDPSLVDVVAELRRELDSLGHELRRHRTARHDCSAAVDDAVRRVVDKIPSFCTTSSATPANAAAPSILSPSSTSSLSSTSTSGVDALALIRWLLRAEATDPGTRAALASARGAMATLLEQVAELEPGSVAAGPGSGGGGAALEAMAELLGVARDSTLHEVRGAAMHVAADALSTLCASVSFCLELLWHIGAVRRFRVVPPNHAWLRHAVNADEAFDHARGLYGDTPLFTASAPVRTALRNCCTQVCADIQAASLDLSSGALPISHASDVLADLEASVQALSCAANDKFDKS
jgi:hypothetical protein